MRRIFGNVGKGSLKESDYHDTKTDEEISEFNTESAQLEIIPCDEKHKEIAIKINVPDLELTKPIDVCCIVDVSGSMGSMASYQDENDVNVTRNDGITILDLVKHSVKTVIHSLTDHDRLCIISFDDYSKCVSDLLPMTDSNKEKAVENLNRLSPGSCTNLWGGLEKGMDSLRSHHPGPSRHKFILLLTDGQPNVQPPRGHLVHLREYFKQYPDFKDNVQISTFGFGYSLDSQLLTDIAVEGCGSFAFIPDAKILGTCFVNCVSNAICTLAQSSSLSLVLKGSARFAGPILGNLPFESPSSKTRKIPIGPLPLGQSRDVVVPLKVSQPEQPYLEAILEYTNPNGKKMRVSALSSPDSKPNPDSHAAYIRNKVVTEGFSILKDSARNLNSASKDMSALSKEVETVSDTDADPRMHALYSDVSGRMSKALTTSERLSRWGKHYILALLRAHQIQVCSNFMDPGLQVYGGTLFEDERDRAGKIFVSLPPPVASKKPSYSSSSYSSSATTSTTPDMDTYYAGADGGCFGGDSTVTVVGRDGIDVTTKMVQLKKGDQVKVEDGIARVLCVIEIPRPTKPLLQFPSGLVITPKHPVCINNKWMLPKDLPGHSTADNPSGVVFNVVLETNHILLVNDIHCITWGHQIPQLSHKFYSKKVVSQLQDMAGWEEGFVKVSGTIRSLVDHSIVKFTQHLIAS